ncbi:MAG: NAD(P)H-dependent glycerol-3-phosphate dehydrogenase [Verrucomicrobiota bacterium]
MKISIIGRGAWGSAMASVIERNGHELAVLGREESDWKDSEAGEAVFIAIPTQALRERLKQLPDPHVPVVSLMKGIEMGSFRRVSQILKEEWPNSAVAAISGPTFASEVKQSAPTAAVVAAETEEVSEMIQHAVHQKYFRLYRSSDLKGVELGGALKNVYAIAAGMCEGLRAGENGMAALMTRSLAEMVRIAGQLGANPETIFGLSGMGDLMLTAYSGQSRNHQAGVALARGKSLKDTLEQIEGTVEGVPTTSAVHSLVQNKNIKAPVIEQLYQVLYEDKSPQEGLEALVVREVYAE